jgi:sugar O-acyltransferase (sialic acid O-acetyltransferase NeuD family)
MEKEKLLLIGGGGHCHSCIDVIEDEGKFEIVGIVDLKERVGESVLGHKILGSNEDIPDLVKKIKNVLITVGHIKSSELRIKLFELAKDSGAHFPKVVSPRSYVSKHCSIGEGTIVMNGCIVKAKAKAKAKAKVGANCILNTRSLIEHDASIGDHVHVCTGAIVNGGTEVGKKSFIGSNSVLRDGITLGENVSIGLGEKVFKSLESEENYISRI